VMLWMVPKAGVCGEGEPHHQALARLALSQGSAAGETSGADASDVFLFMLSGLLTTELPMLSDLLRSRWACAVSVMLGRPESRGRVFVSNADPFTKPEIHLNLGTTGRDVDRLVAGVRVAWQVIRQSPLAELMQSTFMWNDNIVHNDQLARRAVSRFLNGSWHTFGTARMGREGDAGAVVDSRFGVLGTRGLRVVDASVIPTLSVPPSLTCMLLGERAAEWMSEA
jgi:choline dehydrogenase